MVKGKYNGEHPTRKSSSSSINSQFISGKEQKKGDRHVKMTVYEPSSRALQCLKTRQRNRAETGRGVGAELSSLVPQPPTVGLKNCRPSPFTIPVLLQQPCTSMSGHHIRHCLKAHEFTTESTVNSRIMVSHGGFIIPKDHK